MRESGFVTREEGDLNILTDGVQRVILLAIHCRH